MPIRPKVLAVWENETLQLEQLRRRPGDGAEEEKVMNWPSPDLLRLLARLLGAPEDDALDLLGELSATWPWLKESFRATQALSLGTWQAEHARLFLSGFPHTVCPPFASAYRHGHLNGPVVEELCTFYEAIGLEAAVGFEDFLGTIFECAARFIDQYDESRLQLFWHEYLESWVPRFATDLRNGTRMRLYHDMAEQIWALFTRPESGRIQHVLLSKEAG